jgi:hypothetical protein
MLRYTRPVRRWYHGLRKTVRRIFPENCPQALKQFPAIWLHTYCLEFLVVIAQWVALIIRTETLSPVLAAAPARWRPALPGCAPGDRQPSIYSLGQFMFPIALLMAKPARHLRCFVERFPLQAYSWREQHYCRLHLMPDHACWESIPDRLEPFTVEMQHAMHVGTIGYHDHSSFVCRLPQLVWHRFAHPRFQSHPGQTDIFR